VQTHIVPYIVGTMGISSGWYVTQYGMWSWGANWRRIMLLQTVNHQLNAM